VRNAELDEERRIEADNEFYDGDKDQVRTGQALFGIRLGSPISGAKTLSITTLAEYTYYNGRALLC
jgi:hypothetical protein